MYLGQALLRGGQSMKIIISPAKKMRRDLDFLPPKSLPVFLGKAEQLQVYLQSLPLKGLQELLCCSEAIARQSFEAYRQMDLHRQLTPAVLSYDGIQYQYMAPALFTDEEFSYLDRHLRILSGFYGLLRPFDGVTPYRLEMQAKLKTDFCQSLYGFWADAVYGELVREGETILDLASKEYAKAVTPYLKDRDRFITCRFFELDGEKLAEKGVYVKMARGEMVRFLTQMQAEKPEAAKSFDRLGFQFQEDRSDETTYVFTRRKDWKKE